MLVFLFPGMAPALYTDEEKETLISCIKQEALDVGCSSSKDDLWQYFVKKCSRNLHIVICTSPVGDSLRNRCRNFPGLVNNTNIGLLYTLILLLIILT